MHWQNNNEQTTPESGTTSSNNASPRTNLIPSHGVDPESYIFKSCSTAYSSQLQREVATSDSTRVLLRTDSENDSKQSNEGKRLTSTYHNSCKGQTMDTSYDNTCEETDMRFTCLKRVRSDPFIHRQILNSQYFKESQEELLVTKRELHDKLDAINNLHEILRERADERDLLNAIYEDEIQSLRVDLQNASQKIAFLEKRLAMLQGDIDSMGSYGFGSIYKHSKGIPSCFYWFLE